MRCTFIALVLLLTPAAWAIEGAKFSSQIAPILFDNCVACHGAKKAEGGYRIDNFEYLMRPGDSGDVPIAAGKPEESELWRRLVTKDHDLRMPADSDPLAAEQIELIRSWIAAGATFDGTSAAESLLLVMPPIAYPDPPQRYPLPVPVTGIAVTPDGSQVITGGYHELLCWNATDGKLIRRIKNLSQRIYSIKFTADGTRIAVGGGTPGKLGEVRIVDFASGNLIAVCGRTTDAILEMAFSPDGTRLACGGADGLIRLIDMASFKDIQVIASHADWVTSIVWSDDGTKLASASRDKSAKVYTAPAGDLIANYAGHGTPVKGVAFNPEGTQILSVGDDKKLHRWEIEAAKKIAEVNLGGDGFKIVRDKTIIYVPASDKMVHKIDLANNQEVAKFQGLEDWSTSAAIIPAKGWLVAGALNGQIRIWNSNDGAAIVAWSTQPN